MNNYNLYNKQTENMRPVKMDAEKSNKPEKSVAQRAVDELANLTELGGVPDYGKFNSIQTDFQNDNKRLNASRVILSVEPSILLEERPKEREIKIKVLSEDNYHSYSVTLFRGEKNKVIDELKNKNFVDYVEKTINLASEKFSEL